MARVYDHQWQRTAKMVLKRDGYRCRIRGKRCEGRATQVDHIIDVADGGARLDPANLRAACGPCNGGRSARKKHREGWRRSATRIVLVVGPPGSGKSTYVAERSSLRDVVVDYDSIAQALGSRRSHDHGSGSHDVAAAARGAVLTALRRGEVAASRAWVVSANPDAERMFPHHEVVVVDPGRDEVLRRCAGADRPQKWVDLVDEWYRRRTGQVVGASREW